MFFIKDLPAEELEKLKQEKKTFELPSSWTQVREK